jgi:hypothetical protein
MPKRHILPCAVLAVSAAALMVPATAQAGFLDKLNSVIKSVPKVPANKDQAETAAGNAAREKLNRTAPGTSQAVQKVTDTAQTVKVAAAAPAAAGGTIPVPANSGTAEGTAALIKAAPKLGAGAYTLGMPADAATARMKADGLFEDGFARPQIGFKYEQLPDHPLIGGAYGVKHDQSNATESVGLAFTAYPNTPVVSGITRGLGFVPDSAPSVANTLAALREKYGPESMSEYNQLFWLFDYQGHLLSKEQIADLGNCAPQGPRTSGAASDPDFLGNKISKGYVQAIGSYAPACYEVIRVTAHLDTSAPRGDGGNGWGDSVYANAAKDWPNIANDLVSNLNVFINDVPLDYSASVVSRNTVLNNGEATKQQERDAASKRKPTL